MRHPAWSLVALALAVGALMTGCGKDDEGAPVASEKSASDVDSTASADRRTARIRRCQSDPADAATLVPDSAPADRTTIAVVSPVDRRGCPRPNFRIERLPGAGYCIRASSAVGGAIAWRCTAGNALVDPCWVAAVESERGSTVVCMLSPWSLKAVQIEVTRELTFGGRASGQRRSPWGVQLTDGTRCEAYQGAHSDYKGRVVDYYCGNGNKPGVVLLRGADHSSAGWTYDSARFTGTKYLRGPTVQVRIAWFGG